MLKKSLASVVTAALLIAGPGHLTLNAAAQTVTRGAMPATNATPVLGVSRTPSLAAPSLMSPALTMTPVLSAPALLAAPVAVQPAAVAPALAAPTAAAPAASRPDHLSVIRSQDASVGTAEKSAALNAVFDDSLRTGVEAVEVLGSLSAASAPLERASVAAARPAARVGSAKVAAAGESAGIVSLAKRAWNAFLGLFGLGVKKLETPEVLAQRIIDQLNAAKPVYNQKVADASTLVEKMRLQVETETKKVAELERSITALLSDSDPNNDTMATGLINSQKSLQASIETTQGQLVLAEKALEGIKQDRANFFADAQEKLAKIQAGLTKAKAAEIQLELAKLKGGFQIGDLKDNEDRFDQAVNDKIAEAKGATDSVESNPDQILKKAKDELRSSEVQDEIARRKAAIEAAKKAKRDGAGFVADNWFYLKIGAGALAFLISLAIVPEAYMAQVLGQIGTAFVLSLFLGDKESKLDAIAYAAAVGLMVAVPVLAPAAMIVKAVGMVGTAYLLFLLFGPDRIATAKGKGKKDAGGLLMEAGIVAAVIAVVALISKPFRDILARGWNALLGIFGLGVKKLETPEVLAQRIIDQLNAAKPVYNQKVADASTLVEKLRLQIEGQAAKSAELDRGVTALLSDSDPNNDLMAETLLNQKKVIDGSIATNKEQLVLAEKALEGIKQDRANFFADAQEKLAKIQAGLTKAKAAEIQLELAKLKGGFQIGDLKDNEDRFDQAVNDKIAEAKGATDSVESNPDQILKKAKDELRNQEARDEIARRKAAIEAAKKAKENGGGALTQSAALGHFAKVIGVGFALISPMLSSFVFGVLGLVALVMAPEQGRWFGRQLAVIGLGTLAVGGVATLLASKLGLAIGAFGVGMGFVVPAGIALAAGLIAALKAHKTAAKAGEAVSTPVAPVSAPSGVAAGSTTDAGANAPASQPSKGSSFSLKPLGDLLKRAWNAFLGLFGLGVKKLETPEVLAQRLMDQMNAAKLAYNNKVKDAATLAEKLALQIEGDNKKIAEFERTITAILSDSNPENDTMATGLINSQNALKASVTASEEQLRLARAAVEQIKTDRANYFAEAEEKLAKISAGLTKVKAAELRKELAKLKGGFEIGDLKDNEDRFDQAVNDRVAEGKGAADSVESNPDQILKKAKDELRSQDVQAEIARRKAAIEAAKKAKENGAGSSDAGFLGLVKRAWNALLGIFGLGVKKLETPEVLAQRIIDQLNAAKPVYNQKVADAGTLVEKLRLQIEGQTAKSAELDRGVTALLSDSDPNNDLMAETLLNQKKVIDGSITTNKEQLVLAEKALEGIKADRANFFADAQEKLAKIQAGLTKAKAAEIQLELAKLKGGFQIGDLKDNEDRFDQAVNDKIAEAKGATDSVESNPDQILKKAKDELRNQEARDEIARRKAAIEAAKKAKENGGGALNAAFAFGAAEVLGALGLVGMALIGGVVGGFYGISLGLKMMPGLVKKHGPIAGYWAIPLGILIGSVAGGVAVPGLAWLIALAF